MTKLLSKLDISPVVTMNSQTKVVLRTERSQLIVIENFTSDYFDQLNHLPLISRPPIKVRGKNLHQPRDVGFFSDTADGYVYSGIKMKSFSLDDHPLLSEIMTEVNDFLGTEFNGILVNRYNDGRDNVGAHADSEKGLAKNATMTKLYDATLINQNLVASLAYGAVRKFRVRDKFTNKIVHDHDHLPGSLLIMEGDFQSEFKHEIPKQLRVKDARVSLTFRQHV